MTRDSSRYLPCGRGGGVAVALEGHQHGQALLRPQLELLADLINDRLAARVDAEVLERGREVRHIGLQVHAQQLQMQKQMMISSGRKAAILQMLLTCLYRSS